MSDSCTSQSHRASQSAYQRWELASLQEFGTPPPAENTPPLTSTSLHHHEGYQEGYAQGLIEGQSQGLEIAQKRIDEKIDMLQTQCQSMLASMVQQLEAHALHEHQALSQNVLALSLSLSEALFKKIVQIKPEFLLNLIDSVLGELPQNTTPGTIRVSPSDWAVLGDSLQKQFNAGGWRLVQDDQIEAGGCVIDTPTCMLDAQVRTRMQQLIHRLGVPAEQWLKP